MRKPGFALATVLILLGVALFSAGALVTVSGLESKISVSEREGIDAYYVAEAGVDDALFKLKTNDSSCGGSGCASQLQAGTLNYSYTNSNTPHTGQSISVTMASTAGLPVGNATITVTGSVALTGFTAHRQIISTVYLGANTPPTGTTALIAGGNFYVNSGAPRITLSGGNLYANTSMSLNGAVLSLAANCLQTQGNYTNNGSTITTSGGVACIQAANYLPKPTSLALPGFSFSYYSTNNNASYNEYTSSTFEAAAAAKFTSCGCATATFAGPVTYINGNLTTTSAWANKTIVVTGMLIINGGLTINSGMGTFALTINDPGTGQSGLFTSATTTTNDGAITVNGVLYTGGSFYMNSTKNFTINGALFANGDIIFNAGSQISLTYNGTRITNSFGTGSVSALQVKHWEEMY